MTLRSATIADLPVGRADQGADPPPRHHLTPESAYPAADAWHCQLPEMTTPTGGHCAGRRSFPAQRPTSRPVPPPTSRSAPPLARRAPATAHPPSTLTPSVHSGHVCRSIARRHTAPPHRRPPRHRPRCTLVFAESAHTSSYPARLSAATPPQLSFAQPLSLLARTFGRHRTRLHAWYRFGLLHHNVCAEMTTRMGARVAAYKYKARSPSPD